MQVFVKVGIVLVHSSSEHYTTNFIYLINHMLGLQF
jgi:hypothetical protein